MPKYVGVLLLVLVLAFAYVYKQNSGGVVAPNASACTTFNPLSAGSGFFDKTSSLAYYNNKQVSYPKKELAQANQDTNVLGTDSSPDDQKWIEVTLSTQDLKAWDGNKLFIEYPISSGLFDPTPIGTYHIYWKIRYIRMKGGDQAAGDYYDLPNVPDTMFFYSGYALHGAYWHNNFGHPMSHGCVNEPLDKAAILFDWATPRMNPDQGSITATPDNPGTKVVIHE